MKPLRIAIADDNWFVAQHLRGELATLGHIVVGLARTAQELVELVARERPDLALVDIASQTAAMGWLLRERSKRALPYRRLPRQDTLRPPRRRQRTSWGC
jgi:AmiR/NasT family two-component response regulator